jgi:hypothetical protein
MGKIVVRHNFETNSSSMHSLSIRKTDGEYGIEELKRSEAVDDIPCYDAIIILKEGHTETEEEIRNNCYLYKDQMTIWNRSLRMSDSAMQVLSTFRDKLEYALATAYGHRYRGWQDRVEAIKAAFTKVMPGAKLDLYSIERMDEWDWRYDRIGTNQYLLYPFLKKNKITIDEFLTNTKYIVIVNYAEYEKMKWLNMVDESKIADIFKPEIDCSYEMKIEGGVWKLSEGDISFGRSPFRVLGTPEGKARYALASKNSNNIDEVLAIMHEVYPEMKSIELPKDEYSDDGICHGYCDDYSYIIDGIPLRDFILNKKYVVISDGDEYCIWSNFKETPLFNREEYPDEKKEDD